MWYQPFRRDNPALSIHKLSCQFPTFFSLLFSFKLCWPLTNEIDSPVCSVSVLVSVSVLALGPVPKKPVEKKREKWESILPVELKLAASKILYFTQTFPLCSRSSSPPPSSSSSSSSSFPLAVLMMWIKSPEKEKEKPWSREVTSKQETYGSHYYQTL